MRPDPEFVFSIAVIGGIVAIGLLIVIGLSMVAIGIFKKSRKKSIVKELYENKERKNGQGGAHGKW